MLKDSSEPAGLRSFSLLSQVCRNALRLAWRSGKPLAVWRTPGAGEIRGLVSLCELIRDTEPPFDARSPSFAVSRFEASEGQTDLIHGDLVLEAGEIGFVDAEGNSCAAPVTHDQREFAGRLSQMAPDEPVLPITDRHAWPTTAPTVTGEDHYKRVVAEAVATIRSGELAKIVASRVVPSQLPADVDLLDLFEGLAAAYGHAFVCLVSLPDEGVWLLATPETLLSVTDRRLRTMALAGTQPVGSDLDISDVAWTDKFIREQALVSQYVRQALLDCGARQFEEAGPDTVRAGNLAHLHTSFRLDAEREGFSASRFQEFCAQLLRRLQPTSAVCGMPRDEARQFIASHEGYDRDRYCGYIGPVGFRGTTDLYVNLRSSQIIRDTAYLYVGAGVVADSSPEDELRETVEKTRTLGRILWSRSSAAKVSGEEG